jgi:hypothetical protein
MLEPAVSQLSAVSHAVYFLPQTLPLSQHVTVGRFVMLFGTSSGYVNGLADNVILTGVLRGRLV